LQSLTVVEQFQYDPLDRLHDWVAGTEPNRERPCPAQKVSYKLLEQSFNYDDIGNLKQRMTTFGAGPNLSYQYGQNGAGPHAVTQVNSYQYEYDHGGNQTSGPSRTVDYKAFNLPAIVRQGDAKYSFKYGVGHERVFERRPNGDTTTYVGGLYENRSRRGQTTEVFYIQGADRSIAQVEEGKNSPADTTLSFHNDHLGSIQTTTGVVGVTPEHVWYEPFGQTVSPANPTQTVAPLSGLNIGFTEQRSDSELSLIDMTGRIYDSKIGRFLTPDPFVQDPLRSESLNRYSYAWNNPLKWVDPSGFQASDSAGIYRSEVDPIQVVNNTPVSPLPNPESSGSPENGVSLSGKYSDNGQFQLLNENAQLTCALCLMAQMPDVWTNGTLITYSSLSVLPPPPSLNETAHTGPTISAWRVDDPNRGIPGIQNVENAIAVPLVVAVGGWAVGPTYASQALALVPALGIAHGTKALIEGNENEAVHAFAGAALTGLLNRQLTLEAPPAQVTLNRTAGNAWRDEIAERFRRIGMDVSQEVHYSTRLGGRFMDVEVSYQGKVLFGVEAKVGSSRYTTLQQSKDFLIQKAHPGYHVFELRLP